MSRTQYVLGASWTCDGHGFWISPLPDCEIMVASEARRRGAPVPDAELDPPRFTTRDDPASELPW